MSFLSVIKSIGHVFAGVTTAATGLEPILSLIPGVGPIAVTILNAVAAAEGLVTTASTGTVKKNIVTAVVNAQHADVNQTALSATIDEVVAAMNALQKALAGADPAPVPKTA